MTVNVLKFSNEELAPLLAEAKENESEVGFVKSYLSGVVRSLIDNPLIYRSFGAYWWPLKELIIENGVTVLGDNLEAETTEYFRYEDEELTCCAAYAMQQTKLKENQLLSSDNLLDLVGGDVQEYALYDEKLEELAAIIAARKPK